MNELVFSVQTMAYWFLARARTRSLGPLPITDMTGTISCFSATCETSSSMEATYLWLCQYYIFLCILLVRVVRMALAPARVEFMFVLAFLRTPEAHYYFCLKCSASRGRSPSTASPMPSTEGIHRIRRDTSTKTADFVILLTLRVRPDLLSWRHVFTLLVCKSYIHDPVY